MKNNELQIIRQGDDSSCIALGPQGQEMYVNTHRLGFKEANSYLRNLGCTNYAMWMGKLREVPLKDIAYELNQDLKYNQFGLVTNSSEIHIVGTCRALDLVEGRIFTSKIWGKYNSSQDLTYEWHVKTNNGYKKIAYAILKATWVRVIGHGVVEIAAMPPYLNDIMGINSKMAPKYASNDLLSNTHNQLPVLEFSDNIIKSKNTPIQAVIFTENFYTTQEDANLVGNVYFANYYIWQRRVWDSFLFSKIKSYFTKNYVNSYEFFCKHTQVDHLREAMPFDEIIVTLSIEAVFANGLSVYYEYFKKTANGKEKLAVGRQELIWLSKEQKITNMPEELIAEITAVVV
jgi:enediyne polyketide synthase